MKARLSAVIVLLSLICSVASAQDYAVRVTNNTNLRATYNLESRIVEKVRAGTVLTVVDRFNRWLKIERSGGDAWMADWVGFTRLNDQQTSSDVDNCCFVDRQCQTDDEWTSGFWAFQNNQCGLSTATEISTPMTSADSEQADNCCFIGWLCHNDRDWEKGYYAYQTNQCEHPGLEIEGPDSFVDLIHSALDVMRDRSPDWYGYVISGLSKIILDPAAPRSAVESWSGTWRVPPDRMAQYKRDSLISVVGSLTHEACHVHRHNAGQESGGLVGEKACVEAQLAAAVAVYPSGPNWYHNWLRNLIANIEDPTYQWWHD